VNEIMSLMRFFFW